MPKIFKPLTSEWLNKPYPELRGDYPQCMKDPPPKEGEEQHIDGSQPARAILIKDSEYRFRGTRYLHAKKGRGVYNDHGRSRLSQVPKGVAPRIRNSNWEKAAHSKDEWVTYASFPEKGGALPGPRNHYCYVQRMEIVKQVSASLVWIQKVFPLADKNGRPYKFAAHHVLPYEAFHYETDGKPVLDARARVYLSLTPYDINNGHNIAMLPAKNQHVPVHAMVQHPSDHPPWTVLVLREIKRIAADIKKRIAQKKKPHQILDAIVDDLHETEEKMWDNLCELGIQAVTMGLQEMADPSLGNRSTELLMGKSDSGKIYPFKALSARKVAP
ncbi:AHH domain-containing protein [Myxococcus sp. RHSTA-1-4]|uniref:AHH domain-containing protein n=1 Tax=Myxococcus sp. RHSTA-1-4 TaxID=2874601 RepID=UPI001CBD01B0|nr:AHH domain-containing protein [Myxococcus sp. RHSTA-1-4]MBZ4422605.1 AHH domain-containing protein [Myxococcus sp. RHSTA-1-4]